MRKITLPFVKALKESAADRFEHFIQVVIGPRQVGKTTGVMLFLEQTGRPFAYHSADGALLKSAHWLEEIWLQAHLEKKEFLVVDEIQKVENWAGVLKKLWDEQKLHKQTKLKIIILGSSSLWLQKGLSESLAGRFILHKVYHWNEQESAEGYQLDFEQYLRFGGYPASYQFIDNPQAWSEFIEQSILDPVLGKDILSTARVKSPALFKQCFDLVNSYPAQEISYTKLLGQLQDRGNVELVKHYLELFEAGFLLKQLHKFSNKKIKTRVSSPKLLPLCPALVTYQLKGQVDEKLRGRLFELFVGATLNRLPGKLYYWRKGQIEVDYVYQAGAKIWGIEVKSGKKRSAKWLEVFQKEFPAAEVIILSPDNYRDLLRKLY